MMAGDCRAISRSEAGSYGAAPVTYTQVHSVHAACGWQLSQRNGGWQAVEMFVCPLDISIILTVIICNHWLSHVSSSSQ